MFGLVDDLKKDPYALKYFCFLQQNVEHEKMNLYLSALAFLQVNSLRKNRTLLAI